MPILFEENAMETIWARRFIWFHGIEGCCYFIFGDWSSEGILGVIVNGGVGAMSEVAILVMIIVAKEIFEESLGFVLEDGNVGGPDAIWKLESVNSVSFPPNDGLSMKKGAIFIAKFNPFLP
jgi:hypothetical protein